MTLFRTALMTAGLLLAAAASAASAATVIVTDVETGNGNENNVTVAGHGSPWTTPILMTIQGGGTIVVFCDDLDHDVNVGGGQHLSYHTGPVTVDGKGNMLGAGVSNEMGQLANIGKYDYAKGDEDGAIAAQAAIWGIEYGVAVTSSDKTIEGDLLLDLMVKDNGRGDASGLIADNGQQSQITGGVPEPATWAMMLMGFGGLGAALRGARRGRGAAAA